MRLPTIKIHRPDDPKRFMVINKKDFRPDEHRVWGEEPEDAAPTTPAEIAKVAVKKLPDTLAEIEDTALIAEAQEADERKSAAAAYEARLAELSEDGDSEGDGDGDSEES